MENAGKLPVFFFGQRFAQLNLIPIFGLYETVYDFKLVVEPQARKFVT